jgi:Tfp pilus assembly protein PilN
MRVCLNLLPEYKKEEIKKRIAFLKVIKNEVLFSIPILAFFVILATVNFSLKLRMQGTGDSFKLNDSLREYKELEGYEEKFKDVNSKVLYKYKIQKNNLNWSGIFYKINNMVPDGVYLSDLATTDYSISLVGKAKTRDNFLKFQENIKSENCFSDASAPLSSLVSKEDVEFKIDFKIKEDCLKN